MFHFCTLAKALGDENRVRILMALQHGPLCVCQLTALLDVAPSTASKHLALLRQAQLIGCTKNGRWAYYQLPEKPANDSIAKALSWVYESLAQNEKILQDHDKLQAIRRDTKCILPHEHAQDLDHSVFIHAMADGTV